MRLSPRYLRANLVEETNVFAGKGKDFGGVRALRAGALVVDLTAQVIPQGPPRSICNQPAFNPEDGVPQEGGASRRPHVLADPSRGPRLGLEKSRERRVSLSRIHV